MLKLYLSLSSILLLTGCSISKYNHLTCEKVGIHVQAIKPVVSSTTVSKYNTSIDILKNHLTGILVVKQTDSITTRLVFVTELGMKMFDFEAKRGEMNAVYVFEPLNKPKLIEVLKRNFSNMFLLNRNYSTSLYSCSNKHFSKIMYDKRGKEKWYYSGMNTGSTVLNLSLQETFLKRKRASKIEYTYNSDTQSYSQIKCKQYGLIKFYFELTEIQKAND
ncbi:MAG: hypothetical protein V4580_00940 [Bacteroidota bacterium]